MFDFLKRYKYIFIITTLIVVFSISYINYQNAKNTIEESYRKKRELVEYNIVKSFSSLNESYQTTPNNKYLLEQSAEMELLYPELTEINVYSEAEDLIENYESVEEISFYKYSPETAIVAKFSSEDEGVYLELPSSEAEEVKKIFEEEEKLNIVLSKNNYSRTYLPVFTGDEDGSWLDAFVVGIKYNNNYMFEEINRIRNLFLINGLIMLTVFAVFTSSIVYLLKRFEYMAYHDSLTGLANRTLFSNRLKTILEEDEEKNKDIKRALIFADINDFEEINARFGHEVSDLIIKKAAARLNDIFAGCTNMEDVCRIGGVKFAVEFSNFISQAELNRAAEKIIEAFNKPLEIEDNKFFISLTLGISIYPRDGKNIETLFKKADYALYKAKNEQTDYLIYDK